MQNPLWVERIRLIPTEGWAVENQDSQQTGDATQMNYPAQNIGEGAVFSGDMALMHAQDVRQYIYILTPLPSPDEPRCVQPTLPPGTITPLGRLDIVWRSSMGEPGRLITSVCCLALRYLQHMLNSSLLATYTKDSYQPSPTRIKSCFRKYWHRHYISTTNTDTNVWHEFRATFSIPVAAPVSSTSFVPTPFSPTRSFPTTATPIVIATR